MSENIISDKIILAFYINISNVPRDSVEEYMKKVSELLNSKEDVNQVNYFIPVRDSETRVELVYPHYYIVKDENVYKTIEQKESKFRELYNKLMEKLK